MLKSHVFTNEKDCFGCNKCILKCPTHANDATFENLENKVYVNSERCINCGECVSICDHSSRDYTDDTERFFTDLANGVNISIIAAPAARTNFQSQERLFGYLRLCGVKLIYDVSFGADICTWGYIKSITEKKLKTVIAQPCPVVVSYIEHFMPNLIRYLAPVHSPAVCAAIYLNKYKEDQNRIAFLSPCIAKSDEFSDPNSGNYIHYNVTYKKLIEYLKKNNINLNQYPIVKFDNIEGSYGFAFSRPGGLKENVHFYLGDDTWVCQVEGIEEVKKYLNQYENEINHNKPVPLLVDILNCNHGCNMGTGTNKDITRNSIDYKTDTSKQKVDKEAVKRLTDFFNNTLNLHDFERKYNDKSKDITPYNTSKLEEIYLKLGKDTEEKRKINCFCCGYGSCHDFAIAIANGHNHYDNCVHYLEASLAGNLTDFDEMFKDLSIMLENTSKKLNNYSNSSKNLRDISLQTMIISTNASIESAHAGAAGKGFAVVASEIKRLADISSSVIGKNSEDTDIIINEIKQINNHLNKIKQELHKVMRSL